MKKKKKKKNTFSVKFQQCSDSRIKVSTLNKYYVTIFFFFLMESYMVTIQITC